MDCFGCVDPTLDRSDYIRIFRLDGGQAADLRAQNLMDYYADQLGVVLMERRPWICLDSFDMTRIQRFRLNEFPSPRIALALGEEEDGEGNRDGYEDLCRRISDERGGSFVQIGESHWMNLRYGLNVLGRLTAREAAAILMACDLLICTDNGYLDLAAAVQIPVVALLDPRRVSYRMDPAWGTSIPCESGILRITKAMQDCIVQSITTTRKSAKRNGGLDDIFRRGS